MKKTYFEPEMRIVKLHGRLLLNEASGIFGPTQGVGSLNTNLDTADDFEYIGGGSVKGR